MAYDYAKLLSAGIDAAVAVVAPMVAAALVPSQPPALAACPLLNSSYCDLLRGAAAFAVVAVNPLARTARVDLLIPWYSDADAVVMDSAGSALPSAVVFNTLTGGTYEACVLLEAAAAFDLCCVVYFDS